MPRAEERGGTRLGGEESEYRIVSRESWRAAVPRSRHTNRQKLRLRPRPPIDQAPSDVSSEIRGARRLRPSGNR